MLRTRLSLLIALVSVFVMGVGAVGSADGAPEVARGDGVISLSSLGKEAAGIEVQTVARTVLPNQIRVPGTIDVIATRQFDQDAPLSGRIQKVDISLGEFVKKGQVLAVLESTEMNQLAAQFLQSRLDTETAFATQKATLDDEVRQSSQKLHLCDENLKRTKRLYDEKIAAQKDVLQAQAEFDSASSRATVAKSNREILLNSLKARIGLVQNPLRQRLQIIGVDEKRIQQMLAAQNTLTTVPVVAARSGIITSISASAGMSIDPSTTLFQISDLSKVWATANVYESDMARMTLGQKVDVKVQALSDRPAQGVLAYIGSQVDPTTRTLPVRAELDNADGKLKPDMYAELVIQTSGSQPVIALPKNALVSAAPDGSAVFVEQGGNFREVRVRTGRVLGDQVEVVEGLEVGQKVVVRGAFQLHAQLVKDRGGEDLFTSPTEGERMEDHAVDNKAGSVQMNVQTVLIVIGAAFLLGFALSALIMFRGGKARHECDADLGNENQISAPVELRTASTTKKKNSSEG